MSKEEAIKQFEGKCFTNKGIEYYRIKKHRCKHFDTNYFGAARIDRQFKTSNVIEASTVTDDELSEMKEVSVDTFNTIANQAFNSIIK